MLLSGKGTAKTMLLAPEHSLLADDKTGCCAFSEKEEISSEDRIM
jgi:hypothetical protein